MNLIAELNVTQAIKVLQLILYGEYVQSVFSSGYHAVELAGWKMSVGTTLDLLSIKSTLDRKGVVSEAFV
jgi:hypothetical protein